MPYTEPQPGEEIVISGISGVYPQCENVAVLAQKLFAKEDLITDLPNINFSAGKLKSVNKFDAPFFGITNEHGEYMDPLCRILLEKTYEAITDAGYSYLEFKNTNTAVYVANCTSDAEVESTFRTDVKGALICERAQSFLANRISYWLGSHGPSCTVNTACSSSLYALEFAYSAIRRGECEAAIVGGSNLCMAPGMVRLYKNLGITSSRCRSFDDKAIGFCRSEAVSAILVQKAKHARRIYAEIVHIKTNNDGYKRQSILFPSHLVQTKLINEVYDECDVLKEEVAWVEAHGTGTRVGDYQEMKSLQTLCEGRTSPLMAGCVKSNVGHTEAASGLCSIAKTIIAMETGFIPPNLHFNSPQNGIEALQTDQIRIITEKTPWNGGYVAINNFGIGGSNAHLLLKSNLKKDNSYADDHIPRLVTVSGRSVESVESIIKYLHSAPINIELIGLLHKVFSLHIPSHEYRGYAIVDRVNTTKIEQCQQIKHQKRPIWFIYPGMGSQWVSMGKELMALPEFEKSIMECHSILKSFGLNLLQIVTGNDPNTFENVLNGFVGITAFMIALTDLLQLIKLVPDGLIGHSFGEILCGYADKCLNKKQALLAAYYRGLASTGIPTLKGLMAVIGLSSESVKNKCPNTVEVVCYNGTKSCTIAGPVDAIRKLIKEFQNENVFANEVFSGNIPYHSSYIQSVGSVYEKYIEKLIPIPKKRSSKWISSSVPENQWNTTATQYCSANYFRNNFTRPVLMENCLKHIPNDAITIEISPHSIFKTVLNESLNETIANISLMSKHHSKPLQHFFKSLGTLYNLNVDLDLSKLYRPLTFPVSRGTPMISPLIKWNHQKNWYVPFENFDPTTTKNEHSVTISYENEEFRFLQDCVVDGKNIFPESGYLKIVWEAYAKRKKTNYQDLSVIFKNVKFHRTVEISKNEPLDFDILIGHKNGNFEVISNKKLIVDGFIDTLPSENENYQGVSAETNNSTALEMEDIYQDLQIKGYHYENQFKTIVSSNLQGTVGKVRKTDNWILFLNSLIQFFYLSFPMPELRIIHQIHSIEINTQQYSTCFNKKDQEIPVKIVDKQIEAGGAVRIKNINTRYVQRQAIKPPTLQKIDFTPYSIEEILSIQKIIPIITTILLENCLISRLNVTEIVDFADDSQILSTYIYDYFQSLPFYKVDITLNLENKNINTTEIPHYFKITSEPFTSYNTHLLILTNTNNKTALRNTSTMAENSFLLLRQNLDAIDIQIPGFQMFADYHTENGKLTLWHKTSNSKIQRLLRVNHDNFDWVQQLQSLVKENDTKIILYSDSWNSGIIGFFKCLRKEARGSDTRCFLILDQTVLPFDLHNKFYKNQLEYDLAINVYWDGHWGCYIPNQWKPKPVFVPRVYLKEDLENETLYWAEDKSNVETSTLITISYVSLPKEEPQEINDLEKRADSLKYCSWYEFSGCDNLGNAIMGISLRGKVCNTLDQTECLYWRIPKEISSHDAATIPMAYLTALYTLQNSHVEQNHTIMIQNARSHYGHAILVVALINGYQVYTVENNSEDCLHIKTNFPKVQKSVCAEDLNKLHELWAKTSKNEIEILIFSKYQHHTHELLTMINDGGSVIFIGNEDSNTDIIIDNVLRKNLHIQKVIPSKILCNTVLLEKLSKSFRKLLQTTSIKSYSKVVIEEDGSKLLNRSKDALYKTVIRLPVEEMIKDKTALYMARSSFTCSAHEIVIICGGLGGMGFELALWLVNKGARNLMLVSRTGFCNGYKQRKISQMRNEGVKIIISTDNIATQNGVINLLKMANDLGPVSAIFNTTLILQDNTFENQSKESFQTVANPKATATILLDTLSRKMCPDLKTFVVFSSIACGYGNAGQTNYGYANSVMEQICEKRKYDGLSGLAIEWAGVSDVGYLEHIKSDRVPVGTQLQPIRSCLRVLDDFLCHPKGVLTSFIVVDHEIPNSTTTTSIFKTINTIIDKSEKDISEKTTLEDIGLDSIAVAEIKNILEQKCNVFLNVKEILQLQIHELWEMERKRAISNTKENESIKKLSILEEVYANFFEIMTKMKNITALKSVIRLPSFLHYGATEEVPVTKERTIFFIPSIEGFGAVMQPLANNIDFQVLCTQYDIRTTSIRQITRILLPEIEKRLTSTEPFHILGYSYGGLVAMEIAHELEKRGRNGYLYIIDSSPSIVKSISRILYRDQGFYTNTMAFVRALQPAIDMKQFDAGLRKLVNWESIRAYIYESLPDDLIHSKEHLNIILNAINERVNDIETYNSIPKRSLVSKVFFFKPKEQILHQLVPSDLTEFCNQTVQEFVVDGNHFTILKSEVLAYYIMNLYKN